VRRAILLVVLAVVAGFALLENELDRPLRVAGEAPLLLDIAPGTRVDAIGQRLTELGLVRHPAIFKGLVWRRGSGARLKAGRYAIPGGATLVQIVELLEKGETQRHDVTFPEGKAIADMAVIAAGAGLSAEAFRAAAGDPQSIADLDPRAADLEGYLFPDTYDVPQGATAKQVVARMVQRFRGVVTPLAPQIEAAGLTLRQVVTLASIVELETARPEERPRIAAVFLNRMRKGMPLQTDPTVIFALKRAGPYDGNIHKKDLDIDSPYNTYRYAGLPPGPIASPGRASLLAVLAPAATQDLYFVSRNDGTHEFNESLQMHEKAVTRFQRMRPHSAPGSPLKR
jgi:UPF0755 protein